MSVYFFKYWSFDQTNCNDNFFYFDLWKTKKRQANQVAISIFFFGKKKLKKSLIGFSLKVVFILLPILLRVSGRNTYICRTWQKRGTISFRRGQFLVPFFEKFVFLKILPCLAKILKLRLMGRTLHFYIQHCIPYKYFFLLRQVLNLLMKLLSSQM